MLNVTARLDLMSKILDTLKAVVEEARFDFNESSLHVRVVDPSHVAMIQMDIDSAAFDTWELDETQLCFEIDLVRTVVGLGLPNELITFTHNEGTGMINVKLGNVESNIRSIDNSTINVPTLPSLDPDCKVNVSGQEFARILRAARLGSDLVTFTISEKEFNVNAKGPSADVQVKFQKDELQSLECKKPSSSQYSLGYLHPLNKVLSGLETVEIGFGENYPLSLNFTFHDGAVEAQYFLAPRIESDM